MSKCNHQIKIRRNYPHGRGRKKLKKDSKGRLIRSKKPKAVISRICKRCGKIIKNKKDE